MWRRYLAFWSRDIDGALLDEIDFRETLTAQLRRTRDP